MEQEGRPELKDKAIEDEEVVLGEAEAEAEAEAEDRRFCCSNLYSEEVNFSELSLVSDAGREEEEEEEEDGKGDGDRRGLALGERGGAEEEGI